MSTEATRLILTSLPPSLTLPLLRSHLNKCPPFPPHLTDLKILLKPDGTSRRIGFIGFKDHTEAERVLEWVQGSWISGTKGGSRVACDWAKEAKDAPPPRKRSRVVSPVPTSNSTSSVPTATIGSTDDAARFAEFMSVMAPKKKTTLASLKSDELASASTVSSTSRITPVQPLTREEMKDGDDAEDQQTIGFRPLAPIVLEEEEDETQEKIILDDGVANNVEISDADYMASRMKRKLDFDEYVENEDEDIERAHVEEEREKERKEKEKAKVWASEELDPGEMAGPSIVNAETSATNHQDPTYDQAISIITESCRLFVRNLGFSITEEELRSLFEGYGELETVHIPLDTTTRSPKGLAYVTYTSSSAAIAAFDDLDRSSFQGRLLHILPAIVRNSKPEASATGLKGEREEAKKRDTKGLSWGTLFMNSDAVISSIADKLNISKAEILDPTADNAAVRVALAETHVIAETKTYFESEGVDLTSFNVSGPRIFSTLLVKNIPYGTTLSVLHTLFTPFGTPSRLLLPPAGTIAIVEMPDEESGKDAFRGLAYKKLGASVLYLEKAPRSIWNGVRAVDKKLGLGNRAVGSANQSVSGSSFAGTSSTTPTVATKTDATAPATADESGATLFVKNLSFNTTTPTLSNAFAHMRAFSFARVQTKPDPKRPGQTLSMGFGFVGFKTVEAAKSALNIRQGFNLEGHSLEIKFAMRGNAETDDKESKTVSKKGKGAKIIVKNVPFETTRKEIRELFSAYGQLKSVRLPRKQDHKTRGFAFLEFISHAEAQAAFTALEHTHLLGRHLVLQWAEEEGEGESAVEILRKKTKSSFSKEKIGSKKDKFIMSNGDDATGGEDGTEG